MRIDGHSRNSSIHCLGGGRLSSRSLLILKGRFSILTCEIMSGRSAATGGRRSRRFYPYRVEFNAPAQAHLRKKLTNLRQQMDCEVPFVHVDWFIATASLPPLYHDILGLPRTDSELEARLEVNVVENIRNAAGRRVWRAGFNDSGVSNHNRVVERHTSRYGAYWKSYDFAGSVGKQNIFTHPLSFTHDGGREYLQSPERIAGILPRRCRWQPSGFGTDTDCSQPRCERSHGEKRTFVYRLPYRRDERI